MAEDTAPLVTSNEGLGSIRVADEVVSVIAGLATMDVDGVAGMSGGLIGGIAQSDAGDMILVVMDDNCLDRQETIALFQQVARKAAASL